MTVITMSRTGINRMSVLHDLADGRIKVADASTLMGLGRRQVFRLAKAYSEHGPQALVSRRRGRPSNRCYPAVLRAEAIGIIKERYCDFGPTLAAEKLADLLKPAGADPVHALFVFLDLLEREVDVTAEELLRHVHLDTPHPDAASDVDVDRIRGLQRSILIISVFWKAL
jgi:hypothetical protein